MPLSKYERKERLPYGDQSEIAKELNLSEATVSLVMNEKADVLLPETISKVQEAIARRIRRDDGGIGLPVTEVFPAPEQSGSASQVGV